MNARKFQPYYRLLADRFPGWRVAGQFMYREPLDRILRAVTYDSTGSGRDKYRFVAFVMPLYVPSDHVHFNFGRRLKGPHGSDVWDASGKPAEQVVCELAIVMPEVEKFLAMAETPKKMLRNTSRLRWFRTDLWEMEVEIATWMLLAERRRAERAHAQLLKWFEHAGGHDPKRPHDTEVIDRLQRLMDGQEQLESWEHLTRTALGLA